MCRLATTERMPLWVPALPRSRSRRVPKRQVHLVVDDQASGRARAREWPSMRSTASPLRFMNVCGLTSRSTGHRRASNATRLSNSASGGLPGDAVGAAAARRTESRRCGASRRTARPGCPAQRSPASAAPPAPCDASRRGEPAGEETPSMQAAPQYALRSRITAAMRLEQDLDVERQRPRLHVEQVVLGALDDAGLPAQAVDLRPAGHARLFHVALAVARHQVGELRHELRPLGPRADQAHLADEHVDQLRELVQAEAADEPAQPRAPRIVRARPRPARTRPPRPAASSGTSACRTACRRARRAPGRTAPARAATSA